MKKIAIPLSIGTFFPIAANAHDESFSADVFFWSGLSHPVLGFDHLLAMISVGILSAQMGGSAIWTVPMTFVNVMLIGGMLGIKRIALLSVELGIAFSVLALGVALAAERKLSPILAMIFVGCFAIFHGHAHGTEMSSMAEPVLYACGFVTGTTVIHIAGVLIGVFSTKTSHGVQLLRYAGAGIAGIGFHLLIM